MIQILRTVFVRGHQELLKVSQVEHHMFKWPYGTIYSSTSTTWCLDPWRVRSSVISTKFWWSYYIKLFWISLLPTSKCDIWIQKEFTQNRFDLGTYNSQIKNGSRTCYALVLYGVRGHVLHLNNTNVYLTRKQYKCKYDCHIFVNQS